MPRTTIVYTCQSCGAKSPKWLGKCPSCNEWNTYLEEIESRQRRDKKSAVYNPSKENRPKLISDIELTTDSRIVFEDNELNRVLGGGLVPGSTVLLAGEPGIGKSTLLLHIALENDAKKVLYVSGEESESQIRLRAERIGRNNNNCYIYTETFIDQILTEANQIKPAFIIIDSIQTLNSSLVESFSGSITQIRECTAQLIKFSKGTNIPIFIIGHITKEGIIAGPKVLEHMVDVVLQFEGEKNYQYRILRTIKNRYGPASEVGIYEMRANGLKGVSNPTRILISEIDEILSGVAISAIIEGIRPLLIEVQALVSSTVYGMPQRNATGFDTHRLNMLLAVLEKRCGFKLAIKDVFLNITGGIKVNDPAIDLAVICAVLSSNENIPIPKNICFAGEVGLTGEIRPVQRIEQRIAEAEKIRFEKIYISAFNQIPLKSKIQIIKVKKIDDVFSGLFSR